MKRKSYMPEAKRHMERIKYYHEHGGAYGHSQAFPHYTDLGECYSTSTMNRSPDAVSIHQMFLEAKPLMDEMRKWQDETPLGEPPVKG